MDPVLIRQYALALLGRPYHFGGDNPISGFDCSGLVSELLRASGIVQWNYRDCAQGIYDLFERNGSINAFGTGSLAFYGDNAKAITHIGFCLDQHSMIEAGGGTSETDTVDEASARDAFVRIRPIKYRKDFFCVIRPYYKTVAIGG